MGKLKIGDRVKYIRPSEKSFDRDYGVVTEIINNTTIRVYYPLEVYPQHLTGHINNFIKCKQPEYPIKLIND